MGNRARRRAVERVLMSSVGRAAAGSVPASSVGSSARVAAPKAAQARALEVIAGLERARVEADRRAQLEIRRQVHRARRLDVSWERIAGALGLTTGAVTHRYGPFPAGPGGRRQRVPVPAVGRWRDPATGRFL